MSIEVYGRVRLLTDRFASSDNVAKGAIGYVIELYPGEMCEVEFSDRHGITYAQIVTNMAELDAM